MVSIFSPLPFDVHNPVVRSPREEWKPHARMSEKSYEWWYVTMHAYDGSGRPYFLFFDLVQYPGEGWQKRFGCDPVADHRFVHIVGMVSDYERDDYRTLYEMAYLPDAGLWREDLHAVTADVGKANAIWSCGEREMALQATFPGVRMNLRFSDTDKVLWHQDKLGVEGMIQQGAEDDFSFYYSIVHSPTVGQLSLQDPDGNWRELTISGSAWIDRQWGDFYTLTWEWSSFRFDNGARVHLYNFYNGHQEAAYVTAAGEVHRFDGVIVKQNGYVKAPNVGTWVSWGWSYESRSRSRARKRSALSRTPARNFSKSPRSITRSTKAALA